jgi:hypothetical protein
MPTQSVVIKVYCRNDDLEHTAAMLAVTTGHRVELPGKATESKNTYLFIITEIEKYEGEQAFNAAFGFDIIGKIAGVLSWEVMPKEYEYTQCSQVEMDERDRELVQLLDSLPTPISIIERTDHTFVWKWLHASGHSDTCMGAIREALTQMTKTYLLMRGELTG